MAQHLKEVKGKKNGAEKQKTEAPADKEPNSSSYFSPGFSKNHPVTTVRFVRANVSPVADSGSELYHQHVKYLIYKVPVLRIRIRIKMLRILNTAKCCIYLQ
jgi:hypothetical protein